MFCETIPGEPHAGLYITLLTGIMVIYNISAFIETDLLRSLKQKKARHETLQPAFIRLAFSMFMMILVVITQSRIKPAQFI